MTVKAIQPGKKGLVPQTHSLHAGQCYNNLYGQYAAIMWFPSDFVLPFAAGASTEVLDAEDAVLGELYAQPSSPPEPELSANDSTPNSAGMQSMTTNTTGNSTAAVCSQNAYILPLLLGQNEFQIVVTPPEPVEHVTKQRSGTLLLWPDATAGVLLLGRLFCSSGLLSCPSLSFGLLSRPFPMFRLQSRA